MSPAHRSGAASTSDRSAGQREHVARVGDGVLGVAAVALIAGEARLRAEVLGAAPAEAAAPARPAEPGDADAVADRDIAHAVAERLDRADDLVAEDERQCRVGQLAVDDVQVGAADAAGPHPDQHLARPAAPASARSAARSGRPGASSSMARMVAHRPGAGTGQWWRIAVALVVAPATTLPDDAESSRRRDAIVARDQGDAEGRRRPGDEAVERIPECWQGTGLGDVDALQWQQDDRGRVLDELAPAVVGEAEIDSAAFLQLRDLEQRNGGRSHPTACSLGHT